VNDVDHYYLPRSDQDKLADLLYPGAKAPAHIYAASIPSLLEDLAVAITRQDRMGSPIRIASGSDEQPLPVNLHAVEAADALRSELVGWVNLVREQRQLTYTGGGSTLELARWLKRWVMALAMSEGADQALISIQRAVRTARRAVDCPVERPLPAPDAQKLAEADRMILGVRGIATLAKEMGGKFEGLTVRRVRYLANEAKLIEPVQVAGSERLYRVGDVRRAHIELLEAQQQQDIA